MLRILGHLIARRPLICIGLWLVVAALAALYRPDPTRLRLSEPASLLPDSSPFNISMQVYCRAFPDQVSRSNIVVVFHRPSGLTADDRQFLQVVSNDLVKAGLQSEEKWRVTSSMISPFLQGRLESADGQAAMIVVDLDVNFVTQRAMSAVGGVEQIVLPRVPQGLTCEITGSAGIGKEYGARSQIALQRTMWVTILAVLTILVLVYRSPLGALVPLVSIGLSVFIAFRVLDALAMIGWSISNAERTFTVVLLFGAGTDYALFWVSRYREELSRGRSRFNSAVDAMVHIGPVILASAGTTILGLLMLVSADMVVIKNSGKVLGIVLSICLLAAMTLTPAMAYVMGNAFFWPGRPDGASTVGQRSIWPRVAADVVRRPHLVFLFGLLLIGLPAISSFAITLRYDSFGEVAEGSSAARGLELAEKHFSRDELFSTKILIESTDFQFDVERARAASDQIAGRIKNIKGITDVWHLAEPLGSRRKGRFTALLNSPLLREQVTQYYFARDKNILQLEIMQRHPPLSPEATAELSQMQQATRSWADANLKNAYSIYAIGQTPYIVDVKTVADRDLKVVIVWVVVVIWLTVLFFIRRFWLSIFMLAATLITYSAALGLTDWLFVHLLGRAGVDYKIKIFVFVVIVAVGQDYNVFLVMRMLSEMKSFSLDEAVARAIVVTGPVISSCGLIMAATLGSLSTSGMDMTEQLGFAFAAGILLYTFFVRPLLIPSFCLIRERMRAKRAKPANESSPPKAPAPAE